MRTVGKSAEAPRTTSNRARRFTAIALAGGLSLGLAGCGIDGSAAANGNAVKPCDDSWDTANALTLDPSAANTAMQQAIAELIDDVDKSGAKEDAGGYRVDSIPSSLVGAANGVLHRFPADEYVGRTSALQNYGNEVCVDGYGSTYLTPSYLSAMGSLASVGIQIDGKLVRGIDQPTS